MIWLEGIVIFTNLTDFELKSNTEGHGGRSDGASQFEDGDDFVGRIEVVECDVIFCSKALQADDVFKVLVEV